MRSALVAALACSTFACGAASPEPAAPRVASASAPAKAPSGVTLTIDRAGVSASPISNAAAPKVTLHLKDPAGSEGRHVTLVIEGFSTSFGLDVAAGQSEATFTPPPAALAKGSLSIAVEGDPTSAIKLEVVRPSIRLECPSTVDSSAPFQLPVVLSSPAPADGYRVAIRAQYSYGPAGRAPSGGQHLDLTFDGGASRAIALPRAPNAPRLEITVSDALDPNEVRARCEISVRGSTPPESRGGLI